MPILDHVYTGPAWRMSAGVKTYEVITGAFRVIDRGEQFAEVGNGEEPEGRWMIFSDHLGNLERAI